MMNAKGRVSIAVIVVVAFFSGVMFTTVGANIFGLEEGIGTETRAAEGTAIDRDLSSVADFQDAFMEVAERVNPTVVQISSERLATRENGQMRNPFEGTPFEDFFGGFEGPQQPRPQTGLGSGVVIRSDGYVITNNHVVEGADEVTVVMMDGTRYEAEVIGTDAVSDVAVIKVDQENLPFMSVGNSDDVRVGQWVLAFGSPLSESLSNTVTAGIVSATGRLQGGFAPPQSQQGPSQIHNFIQTDAAINPGNSGGPLVDLNGRLIGINTAIISRTGGNQGIGFAIPVNTVQDVADQLIEHGRVDRARLGVSFGPASQSLIQALDLPRGAAVISSVTPGSAAERAGIEAGDVIVAINDKELTNHLQLSQRIGAMHPGETATLTVVRNDERRTFEVQLGGWEGGDEPTTADRSTEDRPSRSQMMDALGFRLSDLTPELARRAGLEEDVDGVIITEIDPSSQAYRAAELRRGNIIIEIDRKRVRNLDEFEEVYNGIEAGDSFLVRLYTGENQTYITALTKPA